MKRALLLAALATLSCAPVPVNKTFVMWPATTIRVVDAESGEPIAGARVRITRYEFPYRREDEVRKLETAKGEVKIARETKSLRTFPLMMHGVPGFGWEACAEADGYAAAQMSMREDGDGVLVVKLPLGSRPCVVEPNNTAPEAGKVRIEGVEKQGARWIVIVAMPPSRTLKKGDSLGSMTVEEIMFQTEGTPVVRRARIAVSGEVKAKYGDLIAAP